MNETTHKATHARSHVSKADMADGLHASGMKFKEGLEEAKDALEDKAVEFKKQMKKKGSEIRHYVHEKPLAALGIAALVGIVCGLWMRK